MAKKAPALDVIDEALVRATEAAIRGAGALPAAKLTTAKLTPRARDELVAALVARGLEAAGKSVRVAVEAQLLALLATGARMPMKELGKRVRGASAKEASAAAEALVARGQAHIALRTAVEVLVGAGDAAMDPAEIAALARACAAMGAALKKAIPAKGKTPKRRVLLREDVAALLAPLTAAAPARDAWKLVAVAMDRLADPVGLVAVPALVRSLRERLSLREVHDALAASVSAGGVELSPETGIELLTHEDAQLCPAGPRGTVLSLARRITDAERA